MKFKKLSELNMNKKKKVIAVDCDGVIHAYSKSWEGGILYDEPVKDTKEGIQKLKDAGYHIMIYTTRTNPDYRNEKEPEQIAQLKEYLKKYEIPYDEIWTGKGKPMADMYIDDRAIPFTGDWNKTIQDVENFKVWNKSKDYMSSAEVNFKG